MDSEQEVLDALEKKQKERIEFCAEELKQLLAKHRCDLVFRQEFVNGVAQQSAIVIVAK